jgi:DNA-binding NtrC family response regulator
MRKPNRILIIDDDELLVASLSDFLTGKGYEVHACHSGQKGISNFEKTQPPVVLLDQELPDVMGLDVCRKLLEIDPTAKIIFITGYATVRYAVDAMQAGAFNYLSKPFELDELLIAIDFAVKNAQMEGKIRIQDYKQRREQQDNKLVGTSEVMNRLREQIKLAANSEANMLITGETGVGKNVVARAIHDLQNKRETFLSINCSAIPENLIEAEYFGHEKGTFTGAEYRREGIFELADGGTLVLDEIGEIPYHLQSKLLSVLEDKKIRRIGGKRSIPVDVRIIAATNQDLETAIKKNQFRQDLYYRLAVFNIEVPPLRDHNEDIPEMAKHFLVCFNRETAKIPANHLKRLIEYTWPGNVRELRNVIERASFLFPGDTIQAADLLLANKTNAAPEAPTALSSSMDENSIQPLEELVGNYITQAMNICSGNKSLAARKLGISLSTLKRKLKNM